VLPDKWKHEEHPEKRGVLARVRDGLDRTLSRLMPRRWIVFVGYFAIAALFVAVIGVRLGQSLFPPSGSNQFQLRFNAPSGTRVPVTEDMMRQVLQTVEREAGDGNTESSLGFVGLQPASYPINTVYLWTSGPQEAIFRIALRPEAKIKLPEFEERLRMKLQNEFPGSTSSPRS
jgi:multidrug efflux pump subunit AcrB